MMKRQTPPGFTSMAWIVLVKPFGPHHCAICFGSVQAFQTNSRGASTVRVMTMVGSPGAATALLLSATFLPLGLQFLEIVVEPVQALVPQAAIVLQPTVNAAKRLGFDLAGPPLRLPAARDETSMLENLQMLGNRRKAHVERLGELGD